MCIQWLYSSPVVQSVYMCIYVASGYTVPAPVVQSVYVCIDVSSGYIVLQWFSQYIHIIDTTWFSQCI